MGLELYDFTVNGETADALCRFSDPAVSGSGRLTVHRPPYEFTWKLRGGYRRCVGQSQFRITMHSKNTAWQFDSGDVESEAQSYMPSAPLPCAARINADLTCVMSGGELLHAGFEFETAPDSSLFAGREFLFAPGTQGSEKTAAAQPGDTVDDAGKTGDTKAVPVFAKTVGIPAGGGARLYLASFGWTAVRLNGRLVSARMSAPVSDYSRRMYYETYDLSAYAGGKVDIEIAVGSGYDADYSQWGWRYFCCKGICPVICENGAVISGGEGWKVGRGAWTEASIYGGETYDASRGFESCGEPETRLPGAPEEKPFDGAFLPDEMPPVMVYREDEPVNSWLTADGRIYDFGANGAGVCRLRLKNTQPGQRITLRHSELVTPDGAFSDWTNRLAKACDVYICRGGDEEYIPYLTYHGFRYVLLSGLDGAEFKLTALRISAGVRVTGSFECSDPTVTRIHQNALASLRSNMQTILTDCCQRDERTPCQMDWQACSEAAALNFDMTSYFQKWGEDIAGGYGCPDWNGDQCETLWLLCRLLGSYRCTCSDDPAAAGTAGRAEKNSLLCAAIAYLDRLDAEHPDGIAPQGFGDWCKPNENKWESYFGAPAVVNGCLYYSAAKKTAEAARGCGCIADASRLEALAAKISAAFCGKYLGPDGDVGAGSQTEQLMALNCGILSEEAAERAFLRLKERVTADCRLDTGIFATPALLPVFSERDQVKTALALLTDCDYPSYGNQIMCDATTLWEQWAYKGSMHSHNHAMFAGIDAQFYRVIAGIRRRGDGEIDISPDIGGMSFVSARCETERGEVSVDYRVMGFCHALSLVIPPNTRASVRLPIEPESEIVYFDGQRNVKPVRADASAAYFELGSGTYNLRAVPVDYVDY